jgi:hypothetical protein
MRAETDATSVWVCNQFGTYVKGEHETSVVGQVVEKRRHGHAPTTRLSLLFSSATALGPSPSSDASRQHRCDTNLELYGCDAICTIRTCSLQG